MQAETRDKLITSIQYFLPQHLLSRAVGKLAESRLALIKNTFISFFVKRYNIDMSIAEQSDPLAFENFNAFFTRALKPGVRPIADAATSIVCPADGAISQLGDIQGDAVFQAKGFHYSLTELVGGDKRLSTLFENGKFATVYLSPRDYHRVHMPYGGTLREMIHVPGDLFSVNTRTAENVPRLFARNERVVAIFDTDIGPMAVVMVGAMIVASVETVWAGLVAPYKRHITRVDYAGQKPVTLLKGEEMGRFKLGSTAIVLFGKDVMDWEPKFQEGVTTLMGEAMGRRR